MFAHRASCFSFYAYGCGRRGLGRYPILRLTCSLLRCVPGGARRRDGLRRSQRDCRCAEARAAVSLSGLLAVWARDGVVRREAGYCCGVRAASKRMRAHGAVCCVCRQADRLCSRLGACVRACVRGLRGAGPSSYSRRVLVQPLVRCQKQCAEQFSRGVRGEGHDQHLLLEGLVGDVEVHVLEGACRIGDAGRLVGAGALRRAWLAARH
mmetsp:Transcript_18623/g.59341  ORF Transcript_18623/g.59341 Transcript_18623/m.59341 type:complete len:209 (-) Transcript_18623:1939-2565(-)